MFLLTDYYLTKASGNFFLIKLNLTLIKLALYTTHLLNVKLFIKKIMKTKNTKNHPLVQFRLEHGLSQSKMAAWLNCKPQRISTIECNGTLLSLVNLFELYKHYKVYNLSLEEYKDFIIELFEHERKKK